MIVWQFSGAIFVARGDRPGPPPLQLGVCPFPCAPIREGSSLFQGFLTLVPSPPGSSRVRPYFVVCRFLLFKVLEVFSLNLV